MWRWLSKAADDPNACMTALSTVLIAAFTGILLCASVRENRESALEFRFAHRARLVVDTDLIKSQDIGDTCSIVIPLRNNGGSPADEVVPVFQRLVVPPKVHFKYSEP